MTMFDRIREATLDALCSGGDIDECRAETRSFLKSIMEHIEDRHDISSVRRADLSMIALPVARRLCGIDGWQDHVHGDALLQACEQHAAPCAMLARFYPNGQAMETYMLGVVSDLYCDLWPHPTPFDPTHK